MNRDEILAEMAQYIGIETEANDHDAMEAALRIIEFLEDIGFDADASAAEAGR